MARGIEVVSRRADEKPGVSTRVDRCNEEKRDG